MDGHAPQVLIISHDVVGSRMAGPGIRAAELAQVLAAAQPVTVIAPEPIDLDAAAVRYGSYAWGRPASLQPWLERADVVVANGHVLQVHPELAAIPQPLVIDLYDPVVLENLELFRHAPAEQRRAQVAQDSALLRRQLAAGDFFLCATERQRDLYLGALLAAGELTPELVDRDPTLRSLIDVVPFGLPATPPRKQRAALRGLLPGIDAEDRIVLWTGGLWDWLDPQTLVRALPEVVRTHPEVRVVFLAGQHPGNTHPMRAPAATRALAADLDLLDRYVFFYDAWIPYERRADVLLEADLAVSLHHRQLEMHYAAVRSRVLDHLWAGLPSLLSDGDPAAALLGAHGAALVVAPGDHVGVAQALCRLLDDAALRAQMSAAARRLAADYTWERVATPLVRFCRHPQRRRAHPASPAPIEPSPSLPQEQPMPDQEARLDAVRRAALAAQEQTWQLVEPVVSGRLRRMRRVVIDHLVRPFVVPMLQRQQEHNAATLRSLYALSESMDQRRSQTLAALDALRAHLAALDRRLDHLEQHQRQYTQQLTELRDLLDAMADQLRGLEEADSFLLDLLRRAGQTGEEP